MGKISLYNITNSFIELFDKIENEELSKEEIQELGNSLALELQNKSTNVICYIRNIELSLEAIKTEIERLTLMKKSIENKSNKFKEYVKTNMDILELQKIETPLGIISIAKNPASVEIYDESLIEEKYKVSKVLTTIDKTIIKDDLKKGKNVQGARLVEDKTSLRIK